PPVKNFTPGRYRGVSVSDLDFPLERERLVSHLTGREAYRTTEFIVARHGGETALIRVRKEPGDALFLKITEAEVLAGPEECAWVDAPDADTGIPTALARAARERAPGKRCVVVHGLYEHVNFILEPAPVQVRVVDVAPPHPPKLLHQVGRVLDAAEKVAPVELCPDITDLVELAKQKPSERYLYPCRGSGAAPQGAEVSYLDQRPEEQDWTLVGCARSRQIHSWFYGEEPPQNIDFCPRKLAALPSEGSVGPTLTKCCLLETGFEVTGDTVTVPWGASLAEVQEALETLVRSVEPEWAPE
ncbi:MAG TPA: hypothetical protein VHJ78_00440, partial [Actinomycetota bacterium]|nr:hypothetical protein [Actinomycetota bacterium]